MDKPKYPIAIGGPISGDVVNTEGDPHMISAAWNPPFRPLADMDTVIRIPYQRFDYFRHRITFEAYFERDNQDELISEVIRRMDRASIEFAESLKLSFNQTVHWLDRNDMLRVK